METAPFYKDVAEAPADARSFFVKAKDGTRLRFSLWGSGARGLAVVLPGRSECIEKSGRVAGDLTMRGFSVAIIDWRGQGLSDRQDLSAMLNHPEVVAVTGPRVMFSHSMGGCIGLRTLLSEHPFQAAILSAPMWGLK